MWNQNGNGNQNNGYDPYGSLDRAKALTNRDPYVEAGTHTLAVISLEEFQHETGAAIRGTFLVLDSTSMRVGTKVAEVWMLQRPAPKPGMTTDSDRFADFCIRLKGAPQGHPIGADIRVLLRDRAAEQLARGMVIRCVGIVKRSKTTQKDYTVKNWSNIEQTPQQIAEMRQKIETSPGLVEQVRGTGGQQYNQAPHPSQMPNQYPAQNPPPQTQGQWQQPQGQQGAPVAPPPGGFLANVPPGHGQGGNGGGGW